ncbi:hypothetical protein ACWCQZ_47780 [Streptomyces sp. NPDC002285]
MTHPHDTETSQIRLTEHRAQADLRTLLQLCAAGRVRCSAKTLRPSAATIAQVAEVLDAGDFYPDEPIAAFAWPLLLQAGGLAQLAAGKLALTTRGQQALTQPVHKVLAGLWQRWLSSTILDEFSRIEAVKGQRAANVLSALKPRRGHVGAALAALAGGEWTAIDQLFTTMRKAGHNPSVARSERAMWKLYLEDSEYGSLGYDGHHPWALLQGRYTMAVLFEYAAPLGLIDVEYVDPAGARDDYQHNWGGDWLERLSRYDGLHAIRLTPLGAYATGQTPTYLPGPTPEPATAGGATGLKVLANHDLVALDGLPPARALLLDAFATRTGDRTWALSPASLLARRARRTQPRRTTHLPRPRRHRPTGHSRHAPGRRRAARRRSPRSLTRPPHRVRGHSHLRTASQRPAHPRARHPPRRSPPFRPRRQTRPLPQSRPHPRTPRHLEATHPANSPDVPPAGDLTHRRCVRWRNPQRTRVILLE